MTTSFDFDEDYTDEEDEEFDASSIIEESDYDEDY